MIRTLVDISECSRPTLFRLFREYLDCTPGNFIWRKKMEFAAELLLKSNLRIGEIADQISIDDHYYFSRNFKKFYGLTASEYRKQNSLIQGRI